MIGNIIKKIENKGYEIEQMIMKEIPKEVLMQHYEEHRDKPFFQDLLDYMTSGKSVIMVVSGDRVIEGMRKLIGATNPLEAEPGSIRGMYASNKTQNIIHGSDSKESALKEIQLFF